MKKNRFGALALAGIFSALAIVCLLLTVTPIATIGTVALAAICGIPVVVECGRRAGWLHFIAVAALAWLIVPAMEGKLLYTAFFGWYTIAKAWLEQKNFSRATEWSIKFALFWITMGIGGGSAYFLFPAAVLNGIGWWVILVGIVVSNLLFVVYDRCLTGLVGMYVTRLQPTLRRLFRM